VSIYNTAISRVTIKTKPLEHWWDYCFVVAHVLIGYADLVSDILAINALSSEGRRELMGLNIAFLLLNVVVDVSLSPSAKDKLLALLQLQPFVQAFETLHAGHSTPNFVRSKKIDAIFRALPSMVLQLFGLLLSLANITTFNFIVLSLSICISIVGSSTTMATLAPKSGNSMFSFRFVVHLLYYVSEVIVRISIFVMLFVSIYAYAFIPLAVELLTRAFLVFGKNGKQFDVNWVITTFLFFGSDAYEGPDIDVVGYLITTIYHFMALVIFNTLATPSLDTLRLLLATRNMTIISCVLVVPKVLLAMFITGWEVEEVVSKQVVSTSKESKMPSNVNVNVNANVNAAPIPLASSSLAPSATGQGVAFTQVSINTV
jgi:hypothetical protein